MNGRKNSVYLVWVLGSLCAVVAAGTFTLGVGPAWLSPSEVVRSLFGGGEEVSRTIVLDIRLPRIVLATLAGCALGVSGAAMQGLFRNPMANPYIVGTSLGVALGAVLTAFAVGLGAAVAVVILDRRDLRLTVTDLLLVGLAVRRPE